MGKSEIPRRVLEAFDDSRRSFLKKLILGSAFVIPAINSFSMSGLGVADASARIGNQELPHDPPTITSLDGCQVSARAPGDFGNCNFVNQNLSGMELNSLDFTSANFAGANLSGSNLSYSIFVNANLSEANLSNANLTGANLANANLARANLKDAILTDANLSGADLKGATH